MPRFDTKRIDPREAVDSSRSANVALPAQASLADVQGAGSTMFAVSRALQGVSERLGQQSATRRSLEQKAQYAADTKAGKAAAAERAVTGESPTAWLATASDTARASYEETAGINAVDRFKLKVQPDLAKMHGDQADIDAYIKEKAATFVTESGMSDGTRASFMVGLSKAQDGMKEDFLKGSIKESLDREEESSVALLSTGIRDKSMLSTEGMKGYRTYLQNKGMADNEIDGIVIKASIAALASGEGDIPAIQTMLQSATGPDGTALADGMHKSELDSAAKTGMAAQKAKLEEAQFADKANMIQGYDKQTDRGIVPSMAVLVADAEKYGMSAEWPTEVRNRAQAAQERFAREHAAARDTRTVSDLWTNYTPLRAATSDVKPSDLVKEGDARFAAAFKSGDAAQIKAVLIHSADTHAPIGVLKPMMTQLDPSNPKQAAQLYAVYNIMRHISPENAAALLDTKTLGRVTEYEYNVEMKGMTEQEAWGAVKSGSDLDDHVVSANMKTAMKIIDKEAPKKFDDSHWYSFSSATPISNMPEMQTAYRLAVQDAVKAGVVPEIAAKSAMAEVQAKYTRVGDRMVRTYGTGDGRGKETGEAMTEMGKTLKSQLVKFNQVDPDADVFFQPIKGSPDTWRLQEASPGGVPSAATRPVIGADGKPTGQREFIDVIPSNLRKAHAAWKSQEDAKKIRNVQTLKQFGVDANGLTAEEVTRITAMLDPSKRKLDIPSYAGPGMIAAMKEKQARDTANVDKAAPLPDYAGPGMKQALATSHARNVKNRTDALKYVNDPAHQLQSFEDFITNIK